MITRSTATSGKDAPTLIAHHVVSVQIVGGGLSAETLELRNWATRLNVAHSWLDVETDDGHRIL